MTDNHINRRSFTVSLLSAVGALSMRNILNASDLSHSLPSNASIDTHAHIFKRGLKIAANARYVPEYDATVNDYIQLLDGNSISNAVLVQPSFLGIDNSYLVSGLNQYSKRLRGIVVIPPTSTFGEMKELAAQGVVGIRLNLVQAKIPDFAQAPWPTFLKNINLLNWSVDVHREAKDISLIVKPLIAAGLKVVVDHFGRPDPKLGVNDPGFVSLLKLGESKNLWVKLSGAYRNGPNGRGDLVALEAISLLKHAVGINRLLWGSDWPHTQFEMASTYISARQSLDRWIQSDADKNLVLRDNPASLYGF